ncbi:MAG: hypothetical protein Q8P25_03415 [Candidatus Curtissbacteria bacterium]|nr:hypothetical protein [Candidatus Curtissbacteria bacterium]
MAERTSVSPESERWVRTPVIWVTLKETETVLRNFGFNLDLRMSGLVQFATQSEISQVQLETIKASSLFVRSYLESGLPEEGILNPPPLTRGTLGKKEQFIFSKDIFRPLTITNPSPAQRRIVSDLSVAMFRGIFAYAIQDQTQEQSIPKVPKLIEIITESVEEYAQRRLTDPKLKRAVRRFLKRYQDEIGGDQNLFIMAKGAHIELWTTRNEEQLKVAEILKQHDTTVLSILTNAGQEFFEQHMQRQYHWFQRPQTPMPMPVSEEDVDLIKNALEEMGVGNKPKNILASYLISGPGKYLAACLLAVFLEEDLAYKEAQDSHIASVTTATDEQEQPKLSDNARQLLEKFGHLINVDDSKIEEEPIEEPLDEENALKFQKIITKKARRQSE